MDKSYVSALSLSTKRTVLTQETLTVLLKLLLWEDVAGNVNEMVLYANAIL